jgi:hypothetical protein
MTVKRHGLLLSLSFWLLVGWTGLARAEHRVVHKRIDCGNFQLETTTDIGESETYFEPGFSQTIRLISPAKHIDRQLDLAQHSSPNPRFGGRPSLDGMVSDAVCVRATTGRIYLDLHSYCANEGARTCKTGMDVSETEWATFYDDTGRRLIANPPTGWTPTEDRRLRALGLGPAIDKGIRLGEDASLF